MKNHANFRGSLIALFVSSGILLSGCSSIGAQYVQPKESENAATILSSPEAAIFSTNEKGCYSGVTNLKNGARIHADKEILIVAERTYINAFCRIPFSFVPEKDAQYKVTVDVVGDKNVGRKIDFAEARKMGCVANVLKVEGETETLVKVLPLKFRTRFACNKLIPKD